MPIYFVQEILPYTEIIHDHDEYYVCNTNCNNNNDTAVIINTQLVIE